MKNQLLLIATILFLISCGPSADEVSQRAMLDNVRMDSISKTESGSAYESKKMQTEAEVVDSLKKFIRSAEMRYRVKNVRLASTQIEDQSAKYGGYVTSSTLRSSVIDTKTVKISNDTLLEITTFLVENDVELRVPNIYLDTLLRVQDTQIEFLDYRNVRAENVRLQLAYNQLRVKRLSEYQKSVENNIDEKAKRYRDANSGIQDIYSAKTSSDEAQYENLRLKESTEYSTVKISIYQRYTYQHEKIQNPEAIEDYKPSYTQRFKAALEVGWNIFIHIIVGITYLWAIFVALIVFYVIYFYVKKYRKRNN